MDIQRFLTNLEENRRIEASMPDPKQEFEKALFKTIVDAINTNSTEFKKFLQSYTSTTRVDNFPTTISTPETVKAIKALEKSLKPVGVDNTDIVVGLENLSSDVRKELQTIPKALKAAKVDTVSVSNLGEILNKLSDLSAEVSTLVKAVKAIKVSPNITVPVPEVKVEATDVKSIVTGLAAVKKAVDIKSIPVANVPTDPLIYYTPGDIDDAGTVQYFGYTDNKGAWYIRKFDTGVAPKTIRFCFGQSNYATNFTNRAALTYVLWGN